MKIAVTAKGAGLGAWLDPVFEESRQLVLVDDEGRFQSWSPDPVSALDPYGAKRVRWLAEERAGMLVTRKLTTEARASLAAAGISVFFAESGCVLELVEAARSGTLRRLA